MKILHVNLISFTISYSLSIEKNFDFVALENIDNADKSKLSVMKHAHGIVLIVFQVKPTTSNDISTI